MPSELKWLVPIVVGTHWPKAEEDRLMALAAVWEEAGRELSQRADELPSLTANVLRSLQGTAGDEFRDFMNRFNQNLPAMAAGANQLGAFVKQVGVEIEYAKLMIIAQ